MDVALWIGGGSCALAALLILAMVRPRALPWVLGTLLVAGAVSGATALVLSAETPFGIGDGVVPQVVGRRECEAMVALEERGLRWQEAGRPPESRARGCRDDEDELASSYGEPNPIVDQDPEPGTDLGEGGLVRLFRLRPVPLR